MYPISHSHQIPFTPRMLCDLTAFQGNQAIFTIVNDFCIAKVGKRSLGGLSQFWVAFTGSISIVGLSPQINRQVSERGDYHCRRMVTIGITRPKQVSARRDLHREGSYRSDISSVGSWLLLIDAWLTLKTLRTVVGQRTKELHD